MRQKSLLNKRGHLARRRGIDSNRKQKQKQKKKIKKKSPYRANQNRLFIPQLRETSSLKVTVYKIFHIVANAVLDISQITPDVSTGRLYGSWHHVEGLRVTVNRVVLAEINCSIPKIFVCLFLHTITNNLHLSTSINTASSNSAEQSAQSPVLRYS